MNRRGFIKRAGLLLLAPTAARAIDFGALGVAPAGGTTILTVAGGWSYFKPMDLIRDELTGELMRVTAVHGESLTVTRGRKTSQL